MSPGQPLPPKENALFKKILKCYEHKQYKNGLKFAKQILTNSKYSEHGETLAMKGLTLNCLGRKEEAYEYVRRGLRNDLTSHVCWHVYGLLQRSDHKYDEAIKCYRNALKWDKDNIQILRDLSLLQVQMRDLDGYRDTRYHLFALRPTQRASWIGFAMAYHLLKDYEMAVKILEEFRKTTGAQNKPAHGVGGSGKSSSLEHYEHSELLLYQAMVYKEGGYCHEALEHFNRYGESEICDKLAVHELKTDIFLSLGRNKEAARLIRDHLIGRNPENQAYYKQLEQAMNLTNGKEQDRLRLYQDFQKQFPKSQMPFRLPLTFISEPKLFEEQVDSYLKRSLRKGQPALFRDFKTLYQTECGSSTPTRWPTNKPLPPKITIIQELLNTYHHNLRRYESFASEEASWGSEDPTSILWVDYYLAQHHDFLGDYEKALSFVNEALEHTPTLIELYVIQAKIYKHAGNIDEAVQCMEMAQSLDTADRYLNSKCAKYLLRANQISEAEEMCSKFTREGVSASENLNEMQCMWFQSESALAYQRMEKWGEALKKCIEIDRHFAEITEDQFDFHTYCMRKMTLRAYVGLLRLEDVLKSHPFYYVAAKIAIEVYLRLYDKPLGDNDVSQDVATSNITPSELKKLRNKQRKAKKQEEKAHAANTKQTTSAAHNKEGKDAETAEAPAEKLVAHKLERPEDPLEEAIKFLKPLQSLACERIETHLLAFEIYHRKGKVMLMLQSLKRAVRINSNNPTLRRQLVLFYSLVEAEKEQLCLPLKQVLDLEMKKLIGAKTVTTAIELNERFLKENIHSLIHRIESSKLIAMLNKDNLEAKKNALNLISHQLEDLSDVSIDVCGHMMKGLRAGEFGPVEESMVEEVMSRCHKLFPLATQFMSDSEKKRQLNHFDKEREDPILEEGLYGEGLEKEKEKEVAEVPTPMLSALKI